MNPKTLYLLGPMSGYPDYNRPEFHRFAKLLRAEGFTVINPAELDEQLGDEEDYTAYYARDLPFLSKAEAGVAMPGWELSRGAKAEAYILGRLLKRPVFQLPAFSLIPLHNLPCLVFNPTNGSE